MSPDDTMTTSIPDIPQIGRDELWDKIERGDRFLLFEVLGAQYYKRHHLPGALHLPPAMHERVVALRAGGITMTGNRGGRLHAADISRIW